ncbi:MAG: hypothetical protein ACXWCZ_08015 [Flavisolibacter sp.]
MRPLFYFLIIISVATCFIFCGNAEKAKAATESIQDLKADTTVKPTGMIAYIRDDSEIRLINQDGSNDHRIWTHPDIKVPLGIHDIAWRPDGKELAFSSSHESVLSIYHADIFCIRPDGSGLRKITNAPEHKKLANYKKGTITVTLQNNHYSFNSGYANAGVFTVYVVGAEMPQQVILSPGSSKTIVFNNVADFGDAAQAIVAMYGGNRWFQGLDVVAGRNTKVPNFSISGDGIPYFGAFRPVWKSDGSQISFRDGFCKLTRTPSVSTIGLPTQRLFGDVQPSGACVWSWGPTTELSNQVIYTQNEGDNGSAFYLMKDGGVHNSSNLLLQYSKTPSRMANDVQWLPNGSGFLYSHFTNYIDVYDDETKKIGSNIFRYDLKTKKTTQITNVRKGFASRFTISPDGQWIVYEVGQVAEGENEETLFELTDLSKFDLYIIKMDGSQERLLVKNGSAPSWSR